MVNGMEAVQSVLQEYGLAAEYIEPVSPHVWKVYSNYGIFALKQLKPARSSEFTDLMIEIEEKGYRSFVPICRTYAGDFFAGRQTENSYYLMPWLQYDQEEERDQKHVYLFKEVAKLHSATVRDIQIRTEDISGFYEATKRDWENDKLVYEQFADRAEKEWYLSPFELQAVTYLTETVSAVNFALERLEEWFEAAKDHDKTRAVINHGSLSSRHFLYNDAGSGFFTNFEKAALGLRKTTCSAFTPECSEAIRKHARSVWTGFIRITNHSRSVKRKSACFSAIWLIRPPCTKC